ncbi:hypothetical protein [Palleronia sp.]|uniref:hypothetical protein n=1 Tax=Palleronia sp. TaxID=1940284 RepID=UPI0035C80794
MTTPIIIGLTGFRQVGKSSVADHLVENHGFQRLHPFEGGKVACRAYFSHIGATEDEARRMTDGDLKDKPSSYLPDEQTPRYFMERFGYFMGVELGPEWTLGRELDRVKNSGQGGRYVVESIVYEVDALRNAGGAVVRINREGVGISGLKTDAAVREIVPDADFDNSGQCKTDMAERFDEMLRSIGIDLRVEEPDFEMALG